VLVRLAAAGFLGGCCGPAVEGTPIPVCVLDTVWVQGDAAEGGNGTEAAPVRTVAEALEISAGCAHANVRLRAAHREDVRIEHRRVTLRGQDTAFDGRIAGRGGTVELEGLILGGARGAAVWQEGGALVVRGCTIRGTRTAPREQGGGAGILVGGGAFANIGESIIEDNDGPGVVAEGAGTRARGWLLTIRRNNRDTAAVVASFAAQERFVGGVHVRDGAHLSLGLSAISDEVFGGVTVRAARASLNGISVARVPTLTSEIGGFGILVEGGGEVEARHALIEDAQVTGLGVYRAYLTTLGGRVSGSGAAVAIYHGAPGEFVPTPSDYQPRACIHGTHVGDNGVPLAGDIGSGPPPAREGFLASPEEDEDLLPAWCHRVPEL